MARKVTVTNDAFPKEAEFEIRGLGLFTNGKPKEVTAEQEAAFESIQGKKLDESAEYIKVEGSSTKASGGDN